MSIQGCKDYVEAIKEEIDNIKKYFNREEFEEIPQLISNLYDEIDCLDFEIEEIEKKKDEITLSIEKMEG